MVLKDDFIKNLGSHIDKLRKERNLSFKEMADKCEMDKAQVYKICMQGGDLRITSLIKIANGLDVPISSLLTF